MTGTNRYTAVVGVDGSPHSLHALDWAVQESQARSGPLHIVHAFPRPPTNKPFGPSEFSPRDSRPQYAAEQVLAAAAHRARTAAPSLDVSARLSAHAPATALIEASRDADMLVVGNRGLGGFTRLLVGSVGVQVAAHAACPVIVVRDIDTDTRGSRVGRVVLGVDGSEPSNPAADFAFMYASQHGLSIEAVNVYQWPPFADHALATYYTADDLREDQTRLLSDALTGYAEQYPKVGVHHIVQHGVPAAVLVAESVGAVLTVVGSRGRGGFTGLLLGSTSQSVLQHAAGPVAIVRVEPARARRTTSQAGTQTRQASSAAAAGVNPIT